ncbi:MAG TPA: tripartite tricarboxylate transporter substrate binding protein [Ramlibacter sp.]|nr:tripartite tricarboxylate transporter substrate binding protein [Ramlibacter sp.]
MSFVLRLLALCLLLAAPLARAQSDWPNQPIRMVVPFAAGGITDITARAVAEEMRLKLGQPVIVDNKPGASGKVGTDFVAKAPADGYTLLMITPSTTSVLAAIEPGLPFDVVGGFQPVALLANATFFLLVNPEVPARSVPELIALAKARPDSLNYASIGQGSAPHLLTEMFKQAAGIQMTHVPYKGEPPALQDLLAGRIQVMFMAAAQPVVESGKARALGTTSLEPWFTLPNVAPLDKAGLPGFKFYGWNGLTVKAGTPPAVVARLNAAANEALQSPRVRKVLMDAGFMPAGGPPEKMGQTIRDDLAAYQKLIRDANLKF